VCRMRYFRDVGVLDRFGDWSDCREGTRQKSPPMRLCVLDTLWHKTRHRANTKFLRLRYMVSTNLRARNDPANWCGL